MTLRLLIDTSSEYSLLGLTQGSTLLSERISLHANQLNQTLLPSLEQLLKEASLPLQAIEEIAVGIGPGSYTGTRVGVAIAKSLHFALAFNAPSLRLRPFYSLLAFLPPHAGSFACVMPSKTGLFYLLQGKDEASLLSCHSSLLLSKDDLLPRLQDAQTRIGKPLREVQTLLPSIPDWILPLPSLPPILHYLETTPLSQDPLPELIYLH